MFVYIFAYFCIFLLIFATMKKFVEILSLVLALALFSGFFACSGPREESAFPPELPALLEQASADVGGQRFEPAMEKALRALELSRQAQSALGEVKALSCIVGIDIMSSRDDDAWDKALQAESLARERGFTEELAGILVSKAKLCSYAQISPETDRNDEGLQYAREALSLSKGHPELEAEACYVIGSLYINKNRWSDPIDQELYRTAGEFLDRGQAIADTYDIPRLRRNGILFRSRWFQQGDRNDEAIDWFEKVRGTLSETDHLTAASLDDRLVRLYTRVGQPEKALERHDDYVLQMQKYIRQKEDETLQEMETRFSVQEKERQIERNRYQIWVLVLALLLAVAVIAIVTIWLRKARRRSLELKRLSEAKQQIIDLLSRDLRNPVSSLSDAISGLSADAATLSPDTIREKCRELSDRAESINSDVADYVGDLLIERSRRIADIGLSQREIQIIRLSAEGLKATEIAERAHLSVHTVNTHRQRIYAKMEVKNVSEMLHKASELGLV